MAEDDVTRVDALTVDKNQGIAAVQAANADALAVIPFVGELNARNFFQHIFQVLHRFTLQLFLSDHADTGGRILHALLGGSRRYDHHVFIIGSADRQRQGHYGRTKPAPNQGV